jgi:hypothetical protein
MVKERRQNAPTGPFQASAKCGKTETVDFMLSQSAERQKRSISCFRKMRKGKIGRFHTSAKCGKAKSVGFILPQNAER